MNSSKINQAKEFAAEKHKGQKRKFSTEPLFNHPLRVAEMVQTYTNDEDMIMASYLHDTIEDTDTSYEEILKEFGKTVANLVLELTSDKDAYKLSGKADYLLKKMMKMSNEALIIKLCDRLDNVSNFPNEPKEFVNKYKKETEYIIKNLNRNLSPIHKELLQKIKEKIKPL